MKESKDKIIVDKDTGLEYRVGSDGKKYLLLPKDETEYKEKALRDKSQG